jgi:hypothetical protein
MLSCRYSPPEWGIWHDWLRAISMHHHLVLSEHAKIVKSIDIEK